MKPTTTRRSLLIGLGTAAVFPVSRSKAASGRRILFGFRPATPLVDIAADGRISGLEYEIITAAMQVPGHAVIPYFGPNARLVQALYRAAVDAIAPAIALEGTQFTLSEPYLIYENIAVTLSRRDLRIGSVADLTGLRVSAFQRARVALGLAFDQAIGAAASYREEAHQHRQALALLRDRADVIIGDRRVLVHHLRTANAESGEWQDWQVHPLFSPVHRSAAFREPTIAVGFNAGLAAIRANGTYQAIMDQYAIPD